MEVGPEEWDDSDLSGVLHCNHRNDSCIKMGSDESHFNVSLIVTDKLSHKTVSTDHNFWSRERRAEAESNQGPAAYQPNFSFTARPNRLRYERGNLRI